MIDIEQRCVFRGLVHVFVAPHAQHLSQLGGERISPRESLPRPPEQPRILELLSRSI